MAHGPSRSSILLSEDDESSDSEDNEAPSEKNINTFWEEYEVSDSGDDEAAPKQIIDLSSEDDEPSDFGHDEAPSETDIESSSEDETSASEDDGPTPVNNQEAPGNEEPPDAQSQPWEPANPSSHRRLVAKGSINGKSLDALADSGASFNVISQELASTLGLTIDQTSAVSVCLPSGAMIRTLGKVSGGFNFSDEDTSYPLFRIKNVFSSILGLNFLAVLEAEQYLLDGYLNGQAADIVPDTGSDIMVMSLLFAKQLGLTVHNGPEHRIKVQFIDGSEAHTIGRVRGVKWRFQRYLDWGKHTLRRDGYEFHIIQNLPVDAIVSNDFIAKVGVFKNHTHRIYGIRYIESKRAHKKEQKMEESELHRRDAAEEDIEELLLTDPVAAEAKRLEEQERRRARDQHKRRVIRDVYICFVFKHLGLPEDNGDWTSEQDHDDGEEEEQIEAPQPQVPRKQLASRAPREGRVVEPAPSHDNTPAFAAYSALESTQPADRSNQRPAYALCMYDVTPDESAARAEQMARAIFERAKAYRRRPDNDSDRIEVVALPQPNPETQSSSADCELAEGCIRHFE
ncbi:hypothetical protein SLS64_005264 [Diaporthe eres]